MTEIVVDEGVHHVGATSTGRIWCCVQIKSHKEWSMFLEIFWL